MHYSPALAAMFRVLPRPVVTALSSLKARVRLARATRIARPLVASLFGPNAVPSTLAATGDVLVARVQPPVQREPLILKLARSESAKRQLEHEAQALTDLRELVSDFPETLPVAHVLEFGTSAEGDWFTQSNLPGKPTAAVALSTEQIVSVTAETLAPFYGATQQQVPCSAAVFESLVSSPIATIAYWRPTLRDQLDELECRLAASLCDKQLTMSRIHGDLGPTNLLWDLNTATISGIVDWTYSVDHLVPEIDLVHLATSLLARERGSEYGETVARLCTGEIDPASLETVRSVLDGSPNGLDICAAAALSWLHHVSFGLERQEQLRANTLWLHYNVDAVVHALTQGFR